MATGQALPTHKYSKLVYNGAMPLPASLIASIVSAVIEAAAQNASATSAAQYEHYAVTRTLPPEAKLGIMLPPPGNGSVIIDGKTLNLSPVAQFRSPQNLIVMPMTIQGKKDVVFLTDASGAVYRVWLINPAEASAHPKN